MRFALLPLALLLPLTAADSLTVFGHKWSIYAAKDWEVQQVDGVETLTLAVARPPVPQPRRPMQFAVAQDTPNFRKVTIECEARRLDKSLLIVFAYQRPSHFNYAHLSVDTPAKVHVHNGIFHVFGGERVRISSLEGPGALPDKEAWYKVRLDWDGETGLVEVKVNGQQYPSLRAVDLSLKDGRVGLGSFNERAQFRNVKITGVPAS
jgi:hypothetical protein